MKRMNHAKGRRGREGVCRRIRHSIRLRTAGVCLLTALASGGVCLGKSGLTTNGVYWGTNYYNPDVVPGGDYDKDPTSAPTVPAWTAGGGGSRVVSNNFLRVSSQAVDIPGTPAVETLMYFYQTNNWNGSQDSTIEFTFRVASVGVNSTYAGSLWFGDGSKWPGLRFSSTSVVWGQGGGSATGNFTQWTTFRLTLSNTNATPVFNLYTNNAPVPVTTSSGYRSAAANYIQFGDAETSSDEYGEMDWESIRWTSAGAFAPESVPEASPTLLLLMAAGGWAMRRRK